MLSIIEEGKLKPRIEGDQLWLAVRSDNIEELASPDAKRLAYDARHQHGFANAGIEKHSGPSPVDTQGSVDTSPRKEGEDYAGYAVLFKLTLPAV
jgi:hypothetical protein